MPELKCVINDGKAGKSYQKVLTENPFLGKKVGDKIGGSDLGLVGYELEITGGSDSAGFPMLKNVDGSGRKKLLLKAGTGARKLKKGVKVRKTVRGNTIADVTAQVNMKVIKYGTKTVPELLGIQVKEEKKEESKGENK